MSERWRAGSAYRVDVASRPVIGISPGQERARWSVWEQEALLLPRNYVIAVQRAGGMAVLLAPDAELVEDPREALELIDGLLLTGGADIDPETYGEPRHAETGETMPERDAFEIAIARGAIELDLPLLGICRGMQLLNVACGGTLHQHLPERLGHEDHRRVPGSFDDADHDVELAPGSLAARVAGETHHAIKSHHHQGVDRVGEGLLLSGRALDDGLPETIEMPDKEFVLGVQWHPEADEESRVIDALVRQAAEQARRDVSPAAS
jgi:putative glutamine amidotransferase